MMSRGFVTFHIVDMSPWPLYLSLGVSASMLSVAEFISSFSISLFKVLMVVSFTLCSFYGWSRDVSWESTLLGSHTILVQDGLKMGFILFILSEIMFFVSFFWSLFYLSVTPSVSIGGWPPSGLSSVNPLGVPLLGSILLMSSSVWVTSSHYSVMTGDKSQAIWSLISTLCLGVAFTLFQVMEYVESSFTMSDSSYGSIFYMATGFHGIHVIIGSVFLFVCLLRMVSNHLSKSHHVGYELAIWYWHFVDVVWLALYLFMYWWGW